MRHVLTIGVVAVAIAACSSAKPASAPSPSAPESCAPDTDCAAGTLAWQRALGQPADLLGPASMPDSRGPIAAAATRDVLVVAAGRSVVGLDVRTGAQRWRLPSSAVPPSQRIAGVVAAGPVVDVETGENHSHKQFDVVIDARSGRVLFSRENQRRNVSPGSTTIWADATQVILPEQDAITSFALPSGTPRWTTHANQAIGTDPYFAVSGRIAVFSDGLFSDRASLRRVNLDTGRPLAGSHLGPHSFLVTAVGGVAIVSPLAGYSLSRNTVLWRQPDLYTDSAGPAFVDTARRLVYAHTTDGSGFAVEVDSGKRSSAPDQVPTSGDGVALRDGVALNMSQADVATYEATTFDLRAGKYRANVKLTPFAAVVNAAELWQSTGMVFGLRCDRPVTESKGLCRQPKIEAVRM